MSPLLIGISAALSLLFLAFLALAMRRKVRNEYDGVPWSMQDGARVLATITDVQSRQDSEGGGAVGAESLGWRSHEANNLADLL